MSAPTPIPQIRLFQTLTYKVKVVGVVKRQDYTVSPVSNGFAFFLFHINLIINSSDTVTLKFDLEKSKVKVMGEVKGQGHIVYPVSNWCTSFSFHINWTNHSWDMSNKSVWPWKNTSKIFEENIGQKKGFKQNSSKI